MTEENSDRVVPVRKKFAVDLEGIPGAGYMWGLSQHPEQIELVSQEVVSVSKEIGGPSTQRFTLVGNQPGDYLLTFELKRRWEKQPAETKELKIHVR